MSGEAVFVYGTLRRGASNHHRMAGATFLGAGRVRASMYRVSWYPGLVLGSGRGCVEGELYRVDAALLSRLDEFEGLEPGSLSGDQYRRVLTAVERIGGEDTIQAWVWEWTGPCNERDAIASGDWLRP